MSNSKNIVWLASYPKSGNTWFRVFLSNLLQDTDSPVSINNLKDIPIASSRDIFDDVSGISSSDLTHDEIDRIRPSVYQKLSDDANEIFYFKIHDVYHFLPDNTPLIPPGATKGIIYFVRNPLDIVVSFAFHANKSFNEIISYMNSEDYAFCDKNSLLPGQLRQKLASWTTHIENWTSVPMCPVHIIRYEDMHGKSKETFTKAVEFLGLDKTGNQIEKALKFSSFETLKNQEASEGFKERPVNSDAFFRRGKTGSWKEHLSNEQVNKVIHHHKQMMIRFGYLTEDITLLG